MVVKTSTYGDSVDPDHVSTVERDCVTAPDVMRIKFCNLDVLDDNVVLKLVSIYVEKLSKRALTAPETMRRPLPLITPLLP